MSIGWCVFLAPHPDGPSSKTRLRETAPSNNRQSTRFVPGPSTSRDENVILVPTLSPPTIYSIPHFLWKRRCEPVAHAVSAQVDGRLPESQDVDPLEQHACQELAAAPPPSALCQVSGSRNVADGDVRGDASPRPLRAAAACSGVKRRPSSPRGLVAPGPRSQRGHVVATGPKQRPRPSPSPKARGSTGEERWRWRCGD